MATHHVAERLLRCAGWVTVVSLCVGIQGCGGPHSSVTLEVNGVVPLSPAPHPVSEEQFHETLSGVIEVDGVPYLIWEGEWESKPRWGMARHYRRLVLLTPYLLDAQTAHESASFVHGYLFDNIGPRYSFRATGRFGVGPNQKPPKLSFEDLADFTQVEKYASGLFPVGATGMLSWETRGTWQEPWFRGWPRVLKVGIRMCLSSPGLHGKPVGVTKGAAVGTYRVGSTSSLEEIAKDILRVNGLMLSEGKLRLITHEVVERNH